MIFITIRQDELFLFLWVHSHVLRQAETELRRERETDLSGDSLPNVHNSQGWARPRPGACSSGRSSLWVSEPSESSLAASQGAPSQSWAQQWSQDWNLGTLIWGASTPDVVLAFGPNTCPQHFSILLSSYFLQVYSQCLSKAISVARSLIPLMDMEFLILH